MKLSFHLFVLFVCSPLVVVCSQQNNHSPVKVLLARAVETQRRQLDASMICMSGFNRQGSIRFAQSSNDNSLSKSPSAADLDVVVVGTPVRAFVPGFPVDHPTNPPTPSPKKSHEQVVVCAAIPVPAPLFDHGTRTPSPEKPVSK